MGMFHLSIFARFRVSSHNLRIKTGRHETPKLALDERLCNKCDSNEIDNEQHCLLTNALHVQIMQNNTFN